MVWYKCIKFFFFFLFFFSGLTTDTGIIAGPPLLHDVKTVSGGSLVLSWESGNCTTSVKCNSTVSIVRHSSDLIEWFYQIVTNGDSVSKTLGQKCIILAVTTGIDFTKS